MPKNQRAQIESFPHRTLVVGSVEGAELVITIACAICGEMVRVYTLPLAQVLGSNPVFTGLLASGMLNGRSFNIEIDGTFVCTFHREVNHAR